MEPKRRGEPTDSSIPSVLPFVGGGGREFKRKSSFSPRKRIDGRTDATRSSEKKTCTDYKTTTID